MTMTSSNHETTWSSPGVTNDDDQSGESLFSAKSEATTETGMDSVYHFESLVVTAVPAAFGLIACLGLVGNLLVILVVAVNRQMRSTTNVLIVSLAVADLFFIVVCVPFTALGYTLKTWPFGSLCCKIYQYVAQVTAYASVYTLVLMSLDRYLAVVHPIHSIGIRTEFNAVVLASVTWIVILATNVPVLLEHESIEYDFVDGDRRSACMNIHIYNDDKMDAARLRHGRVYYGCFFAFAYLIPLTLICVLYGFMVRRLLYGVQPGAGSINAGSGGKTAESLRGKRRVTRLVMIMVIVFGLCWLPLHLIFLIQFVFNYPDKHSGSTELETETEEKRIVMTKIICNCVAYMNSCVNPILYAFLSDNFRKGVRRALANCCPWSQNNRNRITGSKFVFPISFCCCSDQGGFATETGSTRFRSFLDRHSKREHTCTTANGRSRETMTALAQNDIELV